MKRLLLAASVLSLFSAPAFAADNNIDMLIKESRAAEAAGNSQDAILYIQAALVADPSRAATYAALGDFYARAHQTDLAMQYYDEALDIDPSDPAAKKGMAEVSRAERTGKSAALDNN
ncbi:MAG TPA: tetratricopeptide repeat protein [Rhizomicrobium sp.]|nr:tetratricopeptide repeat protein [Rhizomicrobium sp.]